MNDFWDDFGRFPVITQLALIGTFIAILILAILNQASVLNLLNFIIASYALVKKGGSGNGNNLSSSSRPADNNEPEKVSTAEKA